MEKLKVHVVLEILGRPPEHVKEALQTIVTKVGAETKGIKVISAKYHDPIAVEGAKDLYTAFAELELELDSLENYFGVMFAYMPSHMEIINPEEIVLTNYDFNQLAGKLIERLHDYDAITKKSLYEKDFLARKLQEIAPEKFKELLSVPVMPQNQTPAKKTKKADKGQTK